MGDIIFENVGLLTKNDTMECKLKIEGKMRGEGRLHIVWTDNCRRTVVVETKTVQVDSDHVPVSLRLDKAVTMLNQLEAVLEVGEVTIKANAEFIVTPEAFAWDDYQVIMYYAHKPELQQYLRKVGVTAGQYQNKQGWMDKDSARHWWEHDYRYYCDQIAVKYYAAYHDPQYHPKGLRLDEAKAMYKRDRGNKTMLHRKPCFHDEKALEDAMSRMRHTVRTQMRYKPLMYATDETGVTNLVEAWDFCFDPRTIRAMRDWLLQHYGSLAAINKQWGTSFERMEDVAPFTTDEMMAQGNDNLSPWADHRFFMNKTFADAVRKGTDAAHDTDADAMVGLVGCQMPAAFGGYDYWLLSQAIDMIEPYNIGNNREIWRSLAGDKPALTTFFQINDFALWKLWHQMLHGDRGIIIYDEQFRFLDDDGHPTEEAERVAPVFRELQSGIVKQYASSVPSSSSVAIHYSHPSLTAQWMIEVKRRGEDWTDRLGWADRLDSDFLRLRESCVKLAEDNHANYDFVAYGQLEQSDYRMTDLKVLMLPQSIAMSAAECERVRSFAEEGGTVVADARTALMDGHCKMLDGGQLDDLFGIMRTDTVEASGSTGLRITSSEVSDEWTWAKPILQAGSMERLRTVEPGIEVRQGAFALYSDGEGTPAVIVNHYGKGKTVYLNTFITDYHMWRLIPPEGDSLRRLFAAIFQAAGAAPDYELTTRDGKYPDGIELFSNTNGTMRIVGVHRNYQLRISELGPEEYQNQGALETEAELSLKLDGEKAVYDMRRSEFLGVRRKVDFTLDPWEPHVYALLEEAAEALHIGAKPETERGSLFSAKLQLEGNTLGDTHAFRVSVIGPDGKGVSVLRTTIAAPAGRATWSFPFAASDEPGLYTLRVQDVATGLKAEHAVTLR